MHFPSSPHSRLLLMSEDPDSVVPPVKSSQLHQAINRCYPVWYPQHFFQFHYYNPDGGWNRPALYALLTTGLHHNSTFCGQFNTHPRFLKFPEDEGRVVFHPCRYCHFWFFISTELLLWALCLVTISWFYKYGPQLLMLISTENCGKQPLRWPLMMPAPDIAVLYNSLSMSNLLRINRMEQRGRMSLCDQMTKDYNLVLLADPLSLTREAHVARNWS